MRAVPARSSVEALGTVPELRVELYLDRGIAFGSLFSQSPENQTFDS